MSGSATPWWRAATIDERSRVPPAPGDEDPAGPGRVHAWGSHRAESAALVSDEVLRILTAPADAWRDRLAVPDWWRGAAEGDDPDGPGGAAPDVADLVHWLMPLVRRAQHRLRQDLAQRWPRLPPVVADLAEATVAAPPVERLVEPATRVLLLEVHVRAHLRGVPPGQEWPTVARWAAGPAGRESLWAEYPVLVRYVTENLAHWAATSAAFVGHAALDWDEVQRTLLGREAGRFRSVEAVSAFRRSSGDVRIVRLDQGAVVYKPRSLGVDLGFADVLEWLAGAVPALEVRTPVVLDRDDHGWMEFVEQAPCSTQEQVDRYFRTAGALAGAVHLLGGLDIHAGNIIAAGPSPVVVDTETLLAPALPLGWEPDGPGSEVRSVRHTGLVPGTAYVRDDSGTAIPFDHSGFSATEGRTAAFTGSSLQRGEHGEPVLVAGRRTMEDMGNLPVLAGRRRTIDEHEDAFLGGLRDVLEHVRRFPEAFSSVVSRAFAGVTVRYIPRPVRSLLRLLTASLHPNLLRDGRDRDIVLARLTRGATDGSSATLVAAEIEWLRRGLVGDFGAPVGECALVDPSGRRIGTGWPVTPLAAVLDRIRRLDGAEVDRQVHVARLAIASTPGRGAPAPRVVGSSGEEAPPAGTRADPAEVRAAVADIAGRLVRRMIPDTAQWDTLEQVDGRFWVPAVTGRGLWRGAAGVALFLAAAGRVLDLPEAARCAERIVGYLTAPHRPGGRAEGAGPEGAEGVAYAIAVLTGATGDRLRTSVLDRVLADPADRSGDPVALTALVALAPALPLEVRGRVLAAALADLRDRIPALRGDGLWHGRAGAVLALARIAAAGAGPAGAGPLLDDLLGAHDPPLPERPDLAVLCWTGGLAGILAAESALVGGERDRTARRRIARRARCFRAGSLHGLLDSTDLSWGTGLAGLLDAAGRLAGIVDDDEIRAGQDLLLTTVLRRGATAGWSGPVPSVELPGLVDGMSGTGYALLRTLHPDLPDLGSLGPLGRTRAA